MYFVLGPPPQVYNEERLVHQTNGTELTLRNVQPVDKGEYACQVGSIVIVIMVTIMFIIIMELNITIKLWLPLREAVIKKNSKCKLFPKRGGGQPQS